jgi:hypothetical protein
MGKRERRLGYRVPLQMFLNEYVADSQHRCLTVNVSETGFYVHKLLQPLQRDSRVVGLEFELPGTGEMIWARGEVRYDTMDDYFHGTGIRITGIPRLHEKLLHEYIQEKRRDRLQQMLRHVRLNRRH